MRITLDFFPYSFELPWWTADPDASNISVGMLISSQHDFSFSHFGTQRSKKLSWYSKHGTHMGIFLILIHCHYTCDILYLPISYYNHPFYPGITNEKAWLFLHMQTSFQNINKKPPWKSFNLKANQHSIPTLSSSIMFSPKVPKGWDQLVPYGGFLEFFNN